MLINSNNDRPVMTIHKHHLVPKHRGGTDADGLVELTPIQHAMFHYCEWRLWGHWQDKTAWRMLVGAQKGRREGVPHTEETKQKLRESRKKSFADPEYREKHRQGCIARYKTKEGRAHAIANGKKTMNKLNKDPKFQENRLKGLREKCEKTWRIEKEGVVVNMTLKEFVACYGGNLGSVKQRLWKAGMYKGWKFSPVST